MFRFIGTSVRALEFFFVRDDLFSINFGGNERYFFNFQTSPLYKVLKRILN